MSNISKIEIGGTTHSLPRFFIGSCSTGASTAAKTVVCPEFTADDLVAGSLIAVSISNTNSANTPTLSVNGTTAKPVKMNKFGSALDLEEVGYFREGTSLFVYDGSNWVLNSNTDNSLSVGSVLENAVGDLDYYITAEQAQSAILPWALQPTGSSSVPVYVNSHGMICECDDISPSSSSSSPIYIVDVTQSSLPDSAGQIVQSVPLQKIGGTDEWEKPQEGFLAAELQGILSDILNGVPIFLVTNYDGEDTNTFIPLITLNYDFASLTDFTLYFREEGDQVEHRYEGRVWCLTSAFSGGSIYRFDLSFKGPGVYQGLDNTSGNFPMLARGVTTSSSSIENTLFTNKVSIVPSKGKIVSNGSVTGTGANAGGFSIQATGNWVGHYAAGANGTTSSVGYAYLTLGNSTASGTAGNSQGRIYLFGTGAYYNQIESKAASSNKTVYLPNISGELVAHTNNTAVGSGITPTYVNANGQVTACSYSLLPYTTVTSW